MTEEKKKSKRIDLIAEKLGGKVIYATDDFFAEKENLIKEGRGVFIEGKYTDRGKWMDGWESRRKRVPGNDWAIIQMPVLGRIEEFIIDTNHFLGNHPPHACVEGIRLDRELSQKEMEDKDALPWISMLDKVDLHPGTEHTFACQEKQAVNYLRLQIFPDGGIARFRAFGSVEKDWSQVGTSQEVELSAALNGAKALACNDMFFSHMQNLLLPTKGVNMGDGWETKRNRTPNNCDWVIVELATKGKINKVVVDTSHFKGNYPDMCSIEGLCVEEFNNDIHLNINWLTILQKVKLNADSEHIFQSEIENYGPFTHVRLNIYPDGGVSRLRVFGNKSGN